MHFAWLPVVQISIHAPLRERQLRAEQDKRRIVISIHAPLRERQLRAEQDKRRIVISIHAPLRERHILCSFLLHFVKFQSTLPCGSDMV